MNSVKDTIGEIGLSLLVITVLERKLAIGSLTERLLRKEGSGIMVEVKKEKILQVAICPRCGSWSTNCLDKKSLLYQCFHLDCRFLFYLKKHKALVFFKDGSVKKLGR